MKIPTATCNAVKVTILSRTGRERCLKISGRLVKELAIEASTAAVPANSALIFPLALRFAAAAVALALLAMPLMPVAAMNQVAWLARVLAHDESDAGISLARQHFHRPWNE